MSADTWNSAHRRDQLARQAIELVDLGAAHADLNRLLAERAGLGQPERQAGNLFDLLARRAQHFAERAAGVRLQLHVDGAFGDRPVLRPGFADRRVGVVDGRQLAQLRDHLLRAIGGLSQRRARRRLDRDLIFAAVVVGHEVAAEHREDRERAHERHERDEPTPPSDAAATSRASARTSRAGCRTGD